MNLIFLNVVKNIFNPTTSKFPTRSELESQSDSSEGTNVTQNLFEKFGNEENNSPTVLCYSHGYYTKAKGKKMKWNPPSLPLSVGGVRVNRRRK